MSPVSPDDDALLFPATLSPVARWGGHVFMVVFSLMAVGMVVFGVWMAPRAGAFFPYVMGLSAVVLAVTLLSCLLMAPRGYAVSAQGVRVLRYWPRTVVPADLIAAIEPIELRRLTKACGSSGVYGAWGWFTSDKLSWFRAYVTRRRPLVVLRLHRGLPVVLSPDDVDGFIEAVQVLIQPADA